MERLDTIDQEFIGEIIKRRDTLQGPLAGDFIIMKDGTVERFSHDWGEDIQTSDGRFGWSFHLCKDGNADFSGGLNPAIMKSELELVPDDIRLGHFWIFHHNHVTAHNGVHFNIPCKTYRFKQ